MLSGEKSSFTCNEVCANLSLTIPNLKSTSDYRVSAIPYTPYDYNTISGNTDPDDIRGIGRFGNVHNFSFPFCFYDSVFSSFVLSPSGLLTFETSISQCSNNPGSPLPIPFLFPGCGSAWYYPKSTIFGCYAVLDPARDSATNYFASPSERKIEWREVGIAPCRKLIVSYYHIGSWRNFVCSFATPTTFQMVVHESTGLIDVNIENYTCYNFFDEGRGILGIQNWECNKGIAAPGKNATVWTAHNEAYRFTPSSGASRYISSKLYSLNGNYIADADTATNATDSSLLDIQFNNICPVADTTQYILQTSYTACITGNTITGTDTITIIKSHPNPVIVNNSGTLQTDSFSSYQWLLNNAPLPNTNTQTYTATQGGTYQVAVVDSNGCKDTSAPYLYNVTPVKLLGFAANCNAQGMAALHWQTAQELNSKSFTVQRSTTLPNFASIGTIAAAGSSSTIINYNYTDKNDFYKPVYYRLLQTDRDGSFSYSNTIRALPCKKTFAINNIYPNPANSNITIEYNSRNAGRINVTVFDMVGRVVSQHTLQGNSGYNIVRIPVAYLAKGKYIVRLANSEAIVQSAFLKY